MDEEHMTKKQWDAAHEIARYLADCEVDPNELGKVVAFMRKHRASTNLKSDLMTLLNRMLNSGRALVRSKKTLGYYRSIKEAFENHLPEVDDPKELLPVICWAHHLIRYYGEVGPDYIKPIANNEEPEPPPPSTKPPKRDEPKVRKGRKTNALILENKNGGVKVKLIESYGEEITFQRPFFRGKEGEKIKVTVTEIDNNTGRVTGVKPT